MTAYANKGGDKRRKKLSLCSLQCPSLISRPSTFLSSYLPILSSLLPPPPCPSAFLLPFIISSFFLAPLSLWSICDPDIHHRRLTSCVWASSVPRLLLFIPCCVSECVCVALTVYKHGIMCTSDKQQPLCACLYIEGRRSSISDFYIHIQYLCTCVYAKMCAFVYLYTCLHAVLCVCFFSPLTGPPSWSQVIYNVARQRKFVTLQPTQTGRRMQPDDMADGCKRK